MKNSHKLFTVFPILLISGGHLCAQLLPNSSSPETLQLRQDPGDYSDSEWVYELENYDYNLTLTNFLYHTSLQQRWWEYDILEVEGNDSSTPSLNIFVPTDFEANVDFESRVSIESTGRNLRIGGSPSYDSNNALVTFSPTNTSTTTPSMVYHVQAGTAGGFTTNDRWIGMGLPAFDNPYENPDQGLQYVSDYGLGIWDAGINLSFAVNQTNNEAVILWVDDDSASNVPLVFKSRVGAFGGGTPTDALTLNPNGNAVFAGTVTADSYNCLGDSYLGKIIADNLVLSGGIGSGGSAMFIGTVTASAYYYSSDARAKTNISTIENAVEKVMAISGVAFDWKEGALMGSRHLGVLAQEVETVAPEAVATVDGKKVIEPAAMIGILVQAIREQQAQIQELKQQIESK